MFEKITKFINFYITTIRVYLNLIPDFKNQYKIITKINFFYIEK
jgi:hypothetical protein